MKKHFTSFISGIVVTLLTISLINPAFATNIAQTINANFNSINIKLNGTQIASVGENYTLPDGLTQVPFSIVYQGTTYLPIRKVGELVGLNVGWDQESKSAVLGEENVIPTNEISLKNISYDDFKSLLYCYRESGDKLTSKSDTGKFYHYYLTFRNCTCNDNFINEWNAFINQNAKEYLTLLYNEYCKYAPYNGVELHININNREIAVMGCLGMKINQIQQ